jgi:hypothetical protein
MNSGGQVTPSVSATAFLLAEQTAEATVRGDPERSGRVEVSTDLQDFDPSGVCGFQGPDFRIRRQEGLGLRPRSNPRRRADQRGRLRPAYACTPRRRADSRLVPPMVLMKCALSLDAAS